MNVGTVLQGSVQKEGGTLRIIAQLIDTKDESHIWSETFDRPDSDIFEIQDEIASTVTLALRTTLTEVDPSDSADRFTENVAAYDLYSLGRHHWHKRTEDSLLRAIDFFEDAIKLDPQFVLAYYGAGGRLRSATRLQQYEYRRCHRLG